MLLDEFLANKELIYFLLSILYFVSLVAYKLLSKVKQRFLLITAFNLILVAGTYIGLSLASNGEINNKRKVEVATLIASYHKNKQKMDVLMPSAAAHFKALETVLKTNDRITYKMLMDLGYTDFRKEYVTVFYQNIIVRSI